MSTKTEDVRDLVEITIANAEARQLKNYKEFLKIYNKCNKEQKALLLLWTFGNNLIGVRE